MSNKTDDPIIIKENLNTIFSDGLKAGLKGNKVFLQFLSNTPVGVREESRMIVYKEDMKIMLDLLTSVVKYYPQQKEEKSK